MELYESVNCGCKPLRPGGTVSVILSETAPKDGETLILPGSPKDEGRGTCVFPPVLTWAPTLNDTNDSISARIFCPRFAFAQALRAVTPFIVANWVEKTRTDWLNRTDIN